MEGIPGQISLLPVLSHSSPVATQCTEHWHTRVPHVQAQAMHTRKQRHELYSAELQPTESASATVEADRLWNPCILEIYRNMVYRLHDGVPKDI
eukprot:1427128-Amphidinium_carterae.1